jgi:hypothetical protein
MLKFATGERKLASGREGSRALTVMRPGKLHARSLTRLNCAGFGMTPSKEKRKI